MPPRRYKNLVPDSPLHHDLESLVRENQGSATLEEVCEQVLHIPTNDPVVAAALVEGLLEEDARFRLNGNGRVDWAVTSYEESWRRCRRYAVVDVETTNGVRDQQRVIEIGLCIVEDGRLAREWSSLVNPRRPIPYWVRQLTGISDANVRSAPVFEQLLPALLDELEDAILVAHHARFDVACLNVELGRLWGLRLANPYLCTVELARHFLPGCENYRLETLSRSLRLTHTQPHRAGSDARATAELFLRLLGTPGIPWSEFLRPRVPRPPDGNFVETNPSAPA
jgi:DNA polymerase III epsilon subunit family exonuclease